MEKHPSKKKSAVNSESGEIVEPGEAKGEAQDISARKKADEELKASEEKYRTLFNTVPQGVVYQNASGEITSANPAAERILGITLDQMQGRTSIDPRWKAIREDGSDFPGEMHPIPIALKTGKEVKDVVHGVFHPEKNTHIWIKVTAVPLFRPGEKKAYQAYATIEDITERKRAEQALQKSENNFRNLVENTIDIVYSMNSEGVITFITPNVSNYGYAPDDFIGHNLQEFIHPDDAPDVLSTFKKAVETGEAIPSVFRLPRKAGVIIWCEEKSLPVIENGKLTGFTGVIRDITERKQAEEKLWALSTRHQAMLSAIPDIVVEVDKNKVYTWANPAGLEFYGADVIGKEAAFYFEGEQDTYGNVAPLFNGNENVIYVESWQRRRDGEKRLLAWWCRVLKDGSGNVIGALSTARDITERKLSEVALRESEARYRRISDELTDYFYSVRIENGRAVETRHSETCFAVTGYSEKEYFADPYLWHKMIVAEDRDMVVKRVQEIMAGNDTDPVIHRIIRKDGEIRWVCDTPILHKDDRGNLLSYDGIVKDITERKRMEEELQKVQKLDALGLLAGGIAHDFNNLMGGIFGYMDLAHGESDKNLSSEYLSKAMNTIDRARALTRQLLTFAKGGAPIQEIGHLFPFVEETARFALSGANVSSKFDVPQDLWPCNFDKNQIGQVIDNLIINAQQAMPIGGTIEVTARNTALSEKEHPLLKNGNYVKISVKDSGVGIPGELIAKIFDPFFTTKAKGHGLGLATCYSIINRHGGCIDVESEPGKGSTFKVYLPASTEAASSASRNAAKTHKGSGTFLIMDDEEVMRDIIGDMLEAMGYTVIRKENGKDALSFLTSEAKANRTLAGMIFDLTVPGGMGGKAAMEEIRKTHTNIPPAFVASGYADDPVMKNPAEYGFVASICKPIRKVELSELLNGYMETK